MRATPGAGLRGGGRSKFEGERVEASVVAFMISHGKHSILIGKVDGGRGTSDVFDVLPS